MGHSAGVSRLYHQTAPAAGFADRALHGARSALARLRTQGMRPAWHRSPQPAPAPQVSARQPLQVEEIRFRRLRTAADIACVLPLRREINLPLAGDEGFAALEKKEMSAALSALSSGADKSSARSASSPWAVALLPARKSSLARNCRRKCAPMAGK